MAVVPAKALRHAHIFHRRRPTVFVDGAAHIVILADARRHAHISDRGSSNRIRRCRSICLSDDRRRYGHGALPLPAGEREPAAGVARNGATERGASPIISKMCACLSPIGERGGAAVVARDRSKGDGHQPIDACLCPFSLRVVRIAAPHVPGSRPIRHAPMASRSRTGSAAFWMAGLFQDSELRMSRNGRFPGCCVAVGATICRRLGTDEDACSSTPPGGFSARHRRRPPLWHMARRPPMRCRAGCATLR
jgi:hypothetical protein